MLTFPIPGSVSSSSVRDEAFSSSWNALLPCGDSLLTRRQNYRGKGIAGLISLAKDGKRRSLHHFHDRGGHWSSSLCLLFLSFICPIAMSVDGKRMIAGIRSITGLKRMVMRGEFPYLCRHRPRSFDFIVLLPIAVTCLISFTNYDPTHQSKFSWTGLENYKAIFLGQGMAGGPFWHIMGWTVISRLQPRRLRFYRFCVGAFGESGSHSRQKFSVRSIFALGGACVYHDHVFSIMFSFGPLTSPESFWVTRSVGC